MQATGVATSTAGFQPFRRSCLTIPAASYAAVKPIRSSSWCPRAPGGGPPLGRQAAPPVTRLGRSRRPLRCLARLTSSRDSLDEEQVEALQQALPQNDGNGTSRAGGVSPAAPQAAAPSQPLRSPAQQPRSSDGWQPRQLTVQQLQQLTQLHVEDAYGCGVVCSAAELAACLGAHPLNGLCEDPAQLAARAQQYGRNSVRQPKEVTFLELVAEALQDFTILVLLGAGCLSLALELAVGGGAEGGGESSWIESASILAAVVVVVLVTAVNNYQKERQFRSLQAISEDVKVRAVRGAREVALPVAEVLVGDLLLLEAGDILCADGILVSGFEVKVDESHLTGEADDVSKDAHRRASLLGGSKVLSGFGRMLVTAVGPHSQSGAIAEMVAEGKGVATAAPGAGAGLREETLLQQKLASYATVIGRFGLGSAAIAFVAMATRFSVDTFLVQGLPWDWSYLEQYLRFFITGVTILVVAVPEGLPLAVTLALAFSVRRMLADNNLVRHLSAAETMGTATVVCSDKTGTLTQNDMVVSKLWLAGRLLPNLKPYTRQQHRQQGQQQRSGAKPAWLASQQFSQSSSSTSTSSSSHDGTAEPSSRGSHEAAADLPPLAELLAGRLSADSSTAQGGVAHAAGGAQTATASDVPPLTASSRTEGSGRSEVPRGQSSTVVGSTVPVDAVQLLVESVALNSTASIYTDSDGQRRRIGNRTEIALLELAGLLGCDHSALRSAARQLATVPFSSERKRMSTAALPPGAGLAPDGAAPCRVYTKGAAEIVLSRCSHVLEADGSRRTLGHEARAELLREFGGGSQRMLCLAYRDLLLPPEVVLRSGVSLQQDGSVPSVAQPSSATDVLPGYAVEGQTGSRPDGESDGRWGSDVRDLLPLSGSSGEGDGGWDPSRSLPDNMESNLTLLALVGIEDPLRVEVPAAIRQCQASGITVKMLTGDNAATATAIARECGILPPPGTSFAEWEMSSAAAMAALHSASDSSKGSHQAGGRTSSTVDATSDHSVLAVRSSHPGGSLADRSAEEQAVEQLPAGVVMEGSEFRSRVLNADGTIDSGAFLDIWPRLRVLARCTPADKYTIVTGVRSLTHDVVAVTGDGTNDAPALRAANVGFAMAAGTDTAKEAADIVLLDNNFASIVSAALWGRNVYANITRFLQFQLTINLVAVATAVTGAVVAAESPLTAVQMLWVNMIMDSLASLALATDPPDPRLLALPPFSQDHEFVDPRNPTVKHIAGQALYQLGVMYGLIFWAPALLGIPDHSAVAGPSEHYTLVFNTFVFMQLFNQLNARKVLDESGAWEGLAGAPWFQGILGGELLLQVLIVQYGGEWFSTHPLQPREWAVSLGLGATTLLLREALRRVSYGRWSFKLD